MTTQASGPTAFISVGGRLIADDFQEELFEVHLVLRDEIGDAAGDLEFSLIQNCHAVAHCFHLAHLGGGKEAGFALVLRRWMISRTFMRPMGSRPLVGSSR